MSREPVEERLVRTLRRAGELAVPDDALADGPSTAVLRVVPRPPDRRRRSRDEDRVAPPLRRTLTSRPKWVAAAAVVIAAALASGLIGATRPSRPAPAAVSRVRLSASAGEQLRLAVPPTVAKNPTVRGSSLAPTFGNNLQSPRPVSIIPGAGALFVDRPFAYWVYAVRGRYVSSNMGATIPGARFGRRVRGVLYFSAGAGRFYRFVTGVADGALTFQRSRGSEVTLVAADGARYLLHLRTATLVRVNGPTSHAIPTRKQFFVRPNVVGFGQAGLTIPPNFAWGYPPYAACLVPGVPPAAQPAPSLCTFGPDLNDAFIAFSPNVSGTPGLTAHREVVNGIPIYGVRGPDHLVVWYVPSLGVALSTGGSGVQAILHTLHRLR